MSFFEIPATPVELASPIAESSSSQVFDMTDQDILQLAFLEHSAEALGFLRKSYFIEAYRGVILPADLSGADRITYVNLMGLAFEGRFLTYSKVHIGRLAGVGAVRAVCMAFESATLLPFFDTVSEDQLVHVPVLAVETIATT